MKNKIFILSLAIILVFLNLKIVNAQPNYEIGEVVEIPNELEFTLNRVYITEERNPSSSQKPKDVLVINYTLKNISKEDIYLFSDFYYNIYNNGKKKLSEYPLENKFEGSGTLKNGEIAIIEHYYSVDEPINFIQIDVLALNLQDAVGTYKIKGENIEMQ